MGHFVDTVTATGKNRQQAESNAISDFLYEHGHRYSVRDVTNAKFLRKVPPMGVIYQRRGQTIHDYTQPNTAAPQSEWLEEWEFELHTHA